MIDVGLNPEPPHNIDRPTCATSPRCSNSSAPIPSSGAIPPIRPTTNFAAFAGDREFACPGGSEFEFKGKGKSCPVPPRPKPFLTLPTTCAEPLTASYDALSWEGETDAGSVLTHDPGGNPAPFSGCGKVGFKPSIDSQLTSSSAETGAGLDFSLDFHDEGLTSVGGTAQSPVKKAEVILPAGVTINPSVGEGLAVCTPAQLDRETLDSEPGEGCPNASKLGTLHVITPLVEEAIDGQIFLAQQDDAATATPGAENPFDSLIALYFVFRNQNLGVIIKEPVKVEPDPKTGQLVATLDENLQMPFSQLQGPPHRGQRAALITPARLWHLHRATVLTPRSAPQRPPDEDLELSDRQGSRRRPLPSRRRAAFPPPIPSRGDQQQRRLLQPLQHAPDQK